MGRRRNSRHNGRRNRRSRESKRDYISELPEPIIHQILSLLPTPDATRSSILSKQWNRLWNSFPILELNDYELLKCYDQFRWPEYENLFTDANNSLKHRAAAANGSFQKLTFILTKESSCSHIDYWVHFAIERNINELDIRVPCGKYSLPQSFFQANTLTVLNSSGVTLVPLSSFKFFALKKMALSELDVDEDTLYSLVISCPRIEDLCVSSCESFENLWLSSLTLKSLKIEYSYSLERIEIKPKSKEEEITNNISNLPALESLIVCRNDWLQCIKIVSPQLKILVVDINIDNIGTLEVEIDTPNLVSFSYDGQIGSHFLMKKSGLSKATLNLTYPDSYPREPEHWYHCLTNFLQNFDNPECTMFYYFCCKDAIITREIFRDCSLRPIFNIKQLTLRVEPLLNSALPYYLEVVDSFRWIFPDLETVFIKYGDAYENCLKFQFGEADSCIYRIAQMAPFHRSHNG